MKKNFFKKLALVMALTLAVGSVPATNVEAAAAPAFKSKAANLVEGQTKSYGTKNNTKHSASKFVIGNKKVATISYKKGQKSVKVTGVAEGKTTLRVDFKNYKTKKVTPVRIPVYVKALTPEVMQASASSATTITLGGVKLDTFKAEDFTVDGNTVVGYSAATDGKTAVLTLGAVLIPDVKYTLKVGEKSFEVAYSLNATTVAVTEAAYDNDTANQYVAFTVNGQKGDINDLVSNGYNVSFKAVNPITGADATSVLFGATTSGDGKLACPIALVNATDTYLVQVSLIKGSDIIVSEQAKVTIKDLDYNATAVKEYTFAAGATGEEHYLNGTTLVAGEKAELVGFTYTLNGVTESLDSPAATVTANNTACDVVVIESSNPAVISVSATGYTLTANGPGTATIKMTYGDAVQSVVFTVKNEARVLSKVVSDPVKTTVVSTSGNTAKVTLIAKDQYGDPMDSQTLDTVIADPRYVASAVVTAGGTDEAGEVELTITGVASANGSSSVAFVEVAKTKHLGSMTVKVTNVSNFGETKFVINKPTAVQVPYKSDDTTLELSADYGVVYTLSQFTTEKEWLNNVDFDGYFVSYNPDIVDIAEGDMSGANNETLYNNPTGAQSKTGVAIAGSSVAKLSIIGIHAGSTEVVLYDAAGAKVDSVRITVKDTTPTITGITAKENVKVISDLIKIDHSTILSAIATDNNPKLTGVALNITNGNPIYLNIATGADNGVIYIDKDKDTNYTAGTDTKLGVLTMEVLSDGTGSLTSQVGAVSLDTGVTVQKGDKGTVLFRFLVYDEVAKNYTKVLKSIAVTVDVPNN